MTRKPDTASVAEELLGLLERFAACSALPRVKRLHLPPESAAGSKNGEFCALELDDGSIGLSYVLLGDTLAALTREQAQAALAGADPLAIARRYRDDSGVGRTVGFAAVNALSRCLHDRTGFTPDLQTDSIGLLDPRPDDHIGMIGYFPPLAARIAASGARLTVAELNPAFAGEHDGFRVTLDASALEPCNKILSTSTILLNDTLETMLAHCRKASHFAMIGPGAGCLPDPLFARGVTLLGGAWILDREGFCSALAQGESWGRHTAKSAIRRDGYPGFEALLARL